MGDAFGVISLIRRCPFCVHILKFLSEVLRRPGFITLHYIKEQIGRYLLNESVNQNSADPEFLISPTLRAHIKSFARTCL